METSPFPVNGYKILACARRSGPLSREGSLSCHICCDMGPQFFRSYTNDRHIQSALTKHDGIMRIYSNPDPHGFPFSRLLRHRRGCGGPILTQILTGGGGAYLQATDLFFLLVQYGNGLPTRTCVSLSVKIHYLRFYVPLKNFSHICHHCRWRAAKFRPMLGAQGLSTGRDFSPATFAVTRNLGFCGLI
jgi:hypothetical protein